MRRNSAAPGAGLSLARPPLSCGFSPIGYDRITLISPERRDAPASVVPADQVAMGHDSLDVQSAAGTGQPGGTRPAARWRAWPARIGLAPSHMISA